MKLINGNLRRAITVVILAILANVTFVSNSFGIQNGTTSNSSPNVVFVIGEGTSCSGVLLSPVVVATAAHCLVNKDTGLLKKEIYVAPPGSVLERNSDGAILRSSSWTTVISTQITSTFSQAGDKVSDNDLSFIVLSKPFDLVVETVIPSEEESEKFISDKATVRVYGYGKTSFTSSPNSPVTTMMNIYMKSTTYKNTIWIRSQNTAICSGDSGGPVLYSTPTKVYVIGVVTGSAVSSTGPDCAVKNNTDGHYWASVTLLSRYANLAFGAAASALVEAEKRVEAQKTLADSYYQTALRNKEISDSNYQSALDFNSKLAALQIKYEELMREKSLLESENWSLSAKISQLTTIKCSNKKKVLEVTGIDPFCPVGYKKR